MGEPENVEEQNNMNEAEPEKDFNFEEWARENGLTRKTTSALRQEDLHTQAALSLLTTQDIELLGLTLGQRKFLAKSLRDLQQGHSGTHEPGPSLPRPHSGAGPAQPAAQVAAAASGVQQHQGLRDAGKRFDNLFSAEPQSPPGPDQGATSCLNTGFSVPTDCMDKNIAKSAPITEFDPRSILTLKAVTNKATHITSFLTEKAKKRRQKRRDVVYNGDTDKLVVIDDDKHPYSGITIGEWGAANCRLMNYLLQSGKLARGEVEYYLAYTAKIYDFLEKYEWESILDYDHDYREKQAEHGVAWGSITIHSERQLLMPRQTVYRGHRQYSRGAANHRTYNQTGAAKPGTYNQAAPQSEEDEDCRKFLATGYCPFGERCKFRHPRTNQPAKN